jgi:hypothetical protein
MLVVIISMVNLVLTIQRSKISIFSNIDPNSKLPSLIRMVLPTRKSLAMRNWW